MTPDGKFPTIVNSAGREVSVREIGEIHVLEDFGLKFIPTAQDYLENMVMQQWMNGIPHTNPPSHRKIAETLKRRIIEPNVLIKD